MPAPPLEPPRPKKPPHVLPDDAACECGSKVQLLYWRDRYFCPSCLVKLIDRLEKRCKELNEEEP